MSILDDNAPSIAIVFPEISRVDSYGNPTKQPSTVGVHVRCTLTPIASSRDRNGSDQIRADYKFIARDAPIGPWSRVAFPDGRTFAVIDGPHRYDTSEATRHVAARLREER